MPLAASARRAEAAGPFQGRARGRAGARRNGLQQPGVVRGLRPGAEHLDVAVEPKSLFDIDISDEAVESLLARGRRALKAALKDEWQDLLPDGEGSG